MIPPQKIQPYKQNPDINIISSLKETQLFAGISQDIIKLFQQNITVKNYPKGRIIFLKDDIAECFYVISRGWVKLFGQTLNGQEYVIDVLSKGHIIGETAIFENNKYPYAAETTEDAVLLSIPLVILKQKIKENSQLTMKMFNIMAKAGRQKNQELEQRNLQNAPQRIGCFILKLCQKSQTEPIIINLPYEKTLIASKLGMKNETFSRALAKLKKETGIHINGATVKINNIKKLSKYSCNACSSAYPCQEYAANM